MPDSLPLRITGGQWRGQWLDSPVNKQLRPTRDVVREALFNMLQGLLDWEDKVVFDLFCGSGALGIEALSRGAAQATFVDLDIRPVQGNLNKLGLTPPQAVFHRRNALTHKPQVKPDVILADPPYDLKLARKLLSKCGWFGQPGTWWVLETEASEKLDKFLSDEMPNAFTIHRDRTHGSNRLWVLEQLVDIAK